MISSEPIRRHLEVVRTARYYEVGDIDAPVDDLWFVLHGYAQTARDFAELFNPFAAESRLIVAPEALSRFYTRHSDFAVGASWMTKEMRDQEIRDYVRYLNLLHSRIMEVNDRLPTRLTVLGFSQGAATASRWLASGEVRADRLILWGGAPAQELTGGAFASVRTEATLLVAGDTDRYMTPEKFETVFTELRDGGFTVERRKFEGGHELNAEILKELLES